MSGRGMDIISAVLRALGANASRTHVTGGSRSILATPCSCYTMRLRQPWYKHPGPELYRYVVVNLVALDGVANTAFKLLSRNMPQHHEELFPIL